MHDKALKSTIDHFRNVVAEKPPADDVRRADSWEALQEHAALIRAGLLRIA